MQNKTTKHNFTLSANPIDLLQSVLEHSPDNIVLIDKDFKVICFSQKLQSTLSAHFSKELQAGDDYRDYVREDLKPLFFDFFEKALMGETSEIKTKSSDEHSLWFHFKTSPAYDHNNQFLGVFFTAKDIHDYKTAEYEREKTESELKTFFESIGGAACLIDTDKRYVNWNQEFTKKHRLITKKTPVMGGLAYDLFPPEKKALKNKILDAVLQGKNQSIDLEYEINSQKYFYHSIFNPVFTNGKITGITMYSVNLTDMNDIKLALQESETKFRDLVEKSPAGIYIVQNNRYVYVNPSCTKIFGYSQEDLLTTVSPFDVIHQEDAEMVRKKIENRLTGKTDFVHYESQAKTKSGKTIWIEVYGSVTHYQGQPAVIGTILDITENKKAKEALKKKQEEITALAETYEAIIENTKEAIILISPDYKILQLNKIARERIQNNSGKHIRIGADYRKFLYPGENTVVFYSMFEDALKGKNSTQELNVEGLNKETYWISLKATTVFDKNRNIIGVTFTSENIDDRKKAEFEILKLNRLYQLTSQINEAILKQETQQDILSEACRIAVEVGGFRMSWIGLYNENIDAITPYTSNGYVEDFFQYVDVKEIKISEAEIPIAQIIKTKTLQYRNDIQNTVEIPDDFKKELRKRDYQSYIGLPIIIDSKVIGVFSIFMSQKFFFNDDEAKLLLDVTKNIAFALDKIRIRELHYKTEANLSSVFDNTDVGFLLLDKHFNIINFNSTYEASYLKLFGSRIQQNANYVSLAHPERRSDLKKNLNKVLTENQPWRYELKHERNNQIYYYYNSIIPVHNNKNVIIGFCVSSNEITERKLLEIKQEKTLKDLTQRNHDLEKFSYIVSHNLRAPISRILGLNDLLKASQSEEDKAFAVESIDTSVRDLDEVITDMNEILYIRNEIAELKTQVSLQSIVEEAKSSLEKSIQRKNAVIEYDFDSVSELYGIQSYIYNIFSHLISNSIKYSRPDINPHLWISSQKTGNKIILRFLDNGLGIDLNKYENQVFGLYKRFHPDIEGKGMGLYMVKTQVEILGGTIDIISAPNEGTEFILTFEQEITQ